MFCRPCIIVYQYNETNVMHFSLNLLRIKGLYMFRVLLAHPQEALNKRYLVYCVRLMSVGCGTVARFIIQTIQPIITYVEQNLFYTRCLFRIPATKLTTIIEKFCDFSSFTPGKFPGLYSDFVKSTRSVINFIRAL
jgi:hypothetical protein